MFRHILIVDDDKRIRELLRVFLSDSGYGVSTAESINECEVLLKEFIFDVIIMDIMMPKESGVEYLKRAEVKTPIILLSALGQVDDRIVGLESGADDYLTKPFDPRELLLRLNKIIKRVGNTTKEAVFGDFRLDMTNGNLKQGDKVIHLTSAEKSILLEMAKFAGKIVTREYLSQILGEVEDRTVDAHIARLRSKIESSPKSPEFLQTVRGEGYILWTK